MACCKNCGQQVGDNSKFCSNCGAKLTDESRMVSLRREEFAGKIIKCPACGTEIPSFTAYCPGCGHEIHSFDVSESILDFTRQIDKCDTAIANSQKPTKIGWKSWNGLKKTGWVFLNIYTFCIPLVIYLLLPIFGIGSISALNREERKKAQLIKNYSFPNDREDILEALLLIKSQVTSLISEKRDRNTERWVRIWKSKAEQLYEKAEIMFPGDKIANSAYSEISSCEKKIKYGIILRVLLTVILVTLFASFVYFKCGVGNSIKKSIQEANATFEWPTSGMTQMLPTPPSNRGKINNNDDEEFQADLKGVTSAEYEAYINACIEKGFTIEGEKKSIEYIAFNSEGYKLELTQYRSSTEMRIQLKAPISMSTIEWPTSAIAKRLPVPESAYGKIERESDDGFLIYLGNTTKQDFIDYANKCYKAGFKVDYSKSDTYFRAEDSRGYYVYLEYLGNNVMSVRIDRPY